jgi:hypothetical protein
MSARWLKASAALLAVASAAFAPAAGRPAVTLDPRLRVRVGSSARDDGTLVPGDVIDARTAARRFPALVTLSETMARAPAELVPALLWVDAYPAGNTARVEFLPLGGSLSLGRGVTDLSPSVWLHELGHARMHGARPTSPLSRRLLRAIDEGAADYFAACLNDSPRVGDASELRDLTRPPRIGASEWAALAFPAFDPHRMGWALAGRLYAEQPTRGSLLRGLVACLDGDSDLEGAASPAAAVRAMLNACPPTARKPLASVLSAWLPAQLSNLENLP